jgi:hypothetical protein
MNQRHCGFLSRRLKVQPLPDASNIEVILWHFHRTTTRAARCDSRLKGLRLSNTWAGWTQGFIWFEPSKRNTLHPHIVLLCVAYSRLIWTWLLLLPVQFFIVQGRTVTLWPISWYVVPRWLNPYIIEHYRLEVVNDVFNHVVHALSYCPAASRSVRSMMLCYRVACHCSGVRRVINRADAVLQPHVCTSYRH